MESTVKKKKFDLSKYLFVTAILAYPLALFIIMYVYVNFNSFAMAFKVTNVDGTMEWIWNAFNPDGTKMGVFDNFRKYLVGIGIISPAAGESVGNDAALLSVSLINSLKMYIINFCICMPLYIFFSYLLFKHVPGEKGLRIIIMVPQVLSGMIVSLIFLKFVDNALPDIMNSIFSLDESFPQLLADKRYAFGTTLFYMIWISFGINVVIYSNAMNGIDPEIIESAKIDGIDNMFMELWHIILPLIYPTLTTFIVTGFAAILTNAGPIMTFYFNAAPSYLYNMGYYYTVQIINGKTVVYNMLAAGGLIMTLLVAPLTNLLKVLMEKYGPEVD